MANEWTTEYPTEPGYYWIRNFKFTQWDDFIPGPRIAEVWLSESTGELLYYLTGSGDFFGSYGMVGGEWCGPIQPPTELQQDYRWHHALQQARCRYPGGCDRAMQWINGYCDEHKTTAANLTELFHNSLTNRGKQVLANQAVEDLERQEGEGK